MIRWGEERRAKDYGHFCRLIASGPGSEKPVWIISDARRRTDVQYFEENYRHVIKVRVIATEEARQRRGWMFMPGKKCILFSASTLLVGQQNGHPIRKK